MAKDWVSEETWWKERDFRGLHEMHVNVCKGIIRRHPWASNSYLYVDLYAGRGHLEYKGRHFDGSPLIARDMLTRSGLAYEAVHFEKDPAEAALLTEALLVPASLLDVPDPGAQPVTVRPCQVGFPDWLKAKGSQRSRLGLIYADPIRDEIPVDLLNEATRALPRVDLLSYVSATQYNRRRGSFGRRDASRPLLSQHVEAVNKRYGLIRKPHHGDPWQFTFVLWTDWEDMPVWEAHEFRRLDTPEGQRILYEYCDLTNEEQHARANTPLPFGEVNGAALPAPTTRR